MEKVKELKKPSVALTILGCLIIIWVFVTMYKYERIDNEEWETKSAALINPHNPEKNSGMVKFTGIAQEGFIYNEISDKKFSYLSSYLYKYEKVTRKKTETVKKDGRTKLIKKTYVKNEWIYKNSKTEKASVLKIGKINIHFDEAKLLGKHPWQKTYYINKKNADQPEIGDKKIVLKGIPAQSPLFCVGHLSNAFLGKGNFFLVSTYSEGKTLDELKETHWFLGPICFFLLIIGFLLLSQPFIIFSRQKEDIQFFKVVSKMGYPVYFILTFFLSFFIVRYSHISVNLVWIFIIILLVYLGLLLKKKLDK